MDGELLHAIQALSCGKRLFQPSSRAAVQTRPLNGDARADRLSRVHIHGRKARIPVYGSECLEVILEDVTTWIALEKQLV
jgi:hypothetical protein